MSLPTSYLTSTKNLSAILDSIKSAQAPQKFTVKFLESLDFKASGDRLIIGVLKSLGFLTDTGSPTELYYSFLDQTQSAIVLAQGIRNAYADLFQVNVNANQMAKADVFNKFKTLTQGQYSEAVLDKMALTFVELCKLADFKTKPADVPEEQEGQDEASGGGGKEKAKGGKVQFGGLHYNIQLILPESRDPKVYDALFRSLREHLG